MDDAPVDATIWAPATTRCTGCSARTRGRLGPLARVLRRLPPRTEVGAADAGTAGDEPGGHTGRPAGRRLRAATGKAGHPRRRVARALRGAGAADRRATWRRASRCRPPPRVARFREAARGQPARSSTTIWPTAGRQGLRSHSSASQSCLHSARPSMNVELRRRRRQTRASCATARQPRARDRHAASRRHAHAARAEHEAGRHARLRRFHTVYEDLIRRARASQFTPERLAGTTRTITIRDVGHDAARSAPHAGPGRDHRRRRDVFPPSTRAPTPGRWPSSAREDRDAHQHLRPPDHPGRESGEFLAAVSLAALVVGGSGFYDDIFQSLGVPYEPAPLVAGHRPSPGSVEGPRRSWRLSSSSTCTAFAATSWPTSSRSA